MQHINHPMTVMTRHLIALLLTAVGVLVTVCEGFAFSVSPTALTYSASSTTLTPATQTVTFWMGAMKKTLVPRTWTASGSGSWMSISPASGTIAGEQDQISVQVDATGMAVGTYTGTVRIAVADKNGRNQVSTVSVTMVVSGSGTSGGGTGSVTPSILLNPTSLSFSGIQGGPAPLAKPIMLSNPTGGTLTWTLTEAAPWLGLNVMSGSTTTETDSISASVSTTGLLAGSYSTAITVAASGSSNSPQTIPVTLTVTPPTTNGSATLSWSANTETNLAGYNVYIGTQPGTYTTPVSVGNATTYTAGSLKGGTTYYFTVTAINDAGVESLHSAEVSKPIF
jgi:hypothetical protein